MAQWKVTREEIKIFPHPNPQVERLELGKVGQYQVVVQKGLYQSGTTVIFVPEKSILPDAIADVGERRKYLTGTEKNKVKALVMQKELTQGIILPDMEEFKNIPLGQDISALLGITRYIAPIPKELQGEVFSLQTIGNDLHGHEVEIFYPGEFSEGEEIIATEKIHGSQGVAILTSDGQKLITSKGLLRNEQFFLTKNAYSEVADKLNLFNLLGKYFPNKNSTAYYEVVPFFNGYNYGIHNEKRGFIFRLDVEGDTLGYDDIPNEFFDNWAPILYRGPYDFQKLSTLKEGKETVSGKELHIKEGIVITPIIPRRASFGRLSLKLLNSKYKPDEEDFS
jgi:RNA ligase (TIGR02306 family)